MQKFIISVHTMNSQYVLILGCFTNLKTSKIPWYTPS